MEENDIKIANYLDNLMSAAEEEAFMQELGDHADLRKQYEDELLIGSVFITEPDLAIISNIDTRKSLPETFQKKKFPAIVRWIIRYKAVAVLLLLLIAVAVIINLLTGRKDTINTTVTTNKGQENNLKKDSSTPSKPEIASKAIAAELFRHYYKPYVSEQDPVELSIYYNDYKTQQYEAVIAAKETDFQVKGSGEKRESLRQYMQLYKGLCYLEKNEPAKAIIQLNAASQSRFKKNLLFYNAQWWLALAWLKNNDINRATAIAAAITKTASPHRQAAEKLMKELDNH